MSAAVTGIVIGVAGVGLSAASAAGAFSPPPPPSAAQQASSLSKEQIRQMPASYQADAIYNPKYAALNSIIAAQNLFGTPASSATVQAHTTGYYTADGQYLGTQRAYAGATPGARYYQAGDTIQVNTPGAPGQFDLARQALPQSLALQTQVRAGDINDVKTLGPAAYNSIANYDPAATALLQGANAQVQARLNSNGQLDPWTQAALQQNYRSGEAARGLAGGSSDAAMEAYYQTATQEQRQVQNIGLANNQAQVNQGYFGDPFSQILARTSGGVQPPAFNYSANQPSSVGANPVSPGLWQNASNQGYGTQNAGWANQQSAMNSLPQGMATLVNQLHSYYGSGTGGAPPGTTTTPTASYAPGVAGVW